MKRLTLLLLGLVLSAAPLQAQSLSDLLGSLFGSSTTTTTQTAPKPEYPTAKQVVGRWVYQQLDMDYTGDSTIASLGVATAKTQLSPLASAAKLTSGKDYVKLSSNGTFNLVSGERKIDGSYTYIPSTGRLILTVGDKLKAEAIVTLVDGGARIMFNAKQSTAFQMMKEIVMAYPEITVGAIMKK